MWCYISGEAAGEVWNWSPLGVKGLRMKWIASVRCGVHALFLFMQKWSPTTSAMALRARICRASWTTDFGCRRIPDRCPLVGYNLLTTRTKKTERFGHLLFFGSSRLFREIPRKHKTRKYDRQKITQMLFYQVNIHRLEDQVSDLKSPSTRIRIFAKTEIFFLRIHT